LPVNVRNRHSIIDIDRALSIKPCAWLRWISVSLGWTVMIAYMDLSWLQSLDI